MSVLFLYDSFGQLIRENNKALDKTFIYCYDSIGNITSVKTYAYTTDVTPSGTFTEQAYGYSSSHPDRLTNFGGKGISYNTLGCPINHDGMSYVWTKGKLTRQFCGSKAQAGTLYKDTTFTYDAYGRRLSKIHTYDTNPVSSSDYSYTYNTTYDYDSSGRLVHETCVEATTYTGGSSSTREITYLYDESGIIGAIQTLNSTTTDRYYFDRNLRGDVIAIYNNSGTKIATYSYDSWGNCTTKTLVSNNFSNYNPIRYRGYYYDRETKLYYLNARYYNPQWRRFISPDSTDYLDPETPNGLNLYAYCNNDPVNYADHSGHSAFLIAMSILAVAGLITTGIGVATDNNLVTAIGLTAVAVPALITGAMAFSLLTPVGIGIGITTVAAGSGTALFASAEYQEAFTDNNWLLDAGMSEDVYNILMLTTATIATLGTAASSLAYSFNINTITEIGKIKGSNYKGIKFTQIRNGKPVYRSLEFHHGHAHGGHKLHWQLNKWSKTGIKSRGGTAWWTIWLKRIP